jgi:mannosyltransferase OCH1-like enzyme
MFDQYREGHLTLDQLAKQVAAMIRSWSEFILKKSLEMNGRTEEDINKILTQIWSAHEEEIKKKPFEYDGQYFNTLLILKKIN